MSTEMGRKRDEPFVPNTLVGGDRALVRRPPGVTPRLPADPAYGVAEQRLAGEVGRALVELSAP